MPAESDGASVLWLLVEDNPESLPRITGALHRSRLGIESLVVVPGSAGGPRAIALTLARGAAGDIRRAVVVLDRLVDVVEVSVVSGADEVAGYTGLIRQCANALRR